MVNLDESHIFSGVEVVSKDKTTPLSIFPNPTRGDLTLIGEILNEDNLEILVLDLHGRVVKTVVDAENQLSNTSFSVRDLASGTYVLKIQVEGTAFFRKIILME